MSVTIGVDLSGLDDLLNEMGAAVEEAARPAAQAAAQVLYDEVKRNVAALGKKTGNLDSSIYQAFSKDRSGDGLATYHVSWNTRTAPHGHLVENGYLQRYVYYKGNDGQIRPLVRPGMEDKPRPGRRASQAEKDAYYVPRPGGPIQVPARSFVRKASSAFPKAIEAAQAELLKRIAGG